MRCINQKAHSQLRTNWVVAWSSTGVAIALAALAPPSCPPPSNSATFRSPKPVMVTAVQLRHQLVAPSPSAVVVHGLRRATGPKATVQLAVDAATESTLRRQCLLARKRSSVLLTNLVPPTSVGRVVASAQGRVPQFATVAPPTPIKAPRCRRVCRMCVRRLRWLPGRCTAWLGKTARQRASVSHVSALLVARRCRSAVARSTLAARHWMVAVTTGLVAVVGFIWARCDDASGGRKLVCGSAELVCILQLFSACTCILCAHIAQHAVCG